MIYKTQVGGMNILQQPRTSPVTDIFYE